jgi:parallel beta-helix repeat protein
MSRTQFRRHLFVLAMGLGLLSGCGGGSSGSDDEAGGGGSSAQQGQFVDGAVQGLGYRAGSAANSLTGANGVFDYLTGDTLSFFVGGIQLGSATGARWLTPVELAGGNPNSDAAKNLARFLMALDNDNNLANGIVITQAVRDQAAQITSPASSFAIDEASFNLASPGQFITNQLMRTLPTQAAAKAHLDCTLIDIADNILGNDGCGDPDPEPVTKTFRICPETGSTAQSLQDAALVAFFDAREGDTIEFCEGDFSFTTGLFLHSKRGITIKGAGKDRTVLNFDESGSSEGINVASSDGIVIEGLTVEDTPGNAVRIFRSNYVTLRDVRTLWNDADPAAAGYQTSPNNGAYGLYPVECRYVLIEDSESRGASDAGIYVGQTSDVIVRNTLAEYNVAGFEFENTFRAVFENNIATNNTGGFLVFDLPGLRQYGEKNIVRNNKSFANNTENFAPIGNIVGLTPRGTGMLILATDQLEIYGNEVYDNDSAGIYIVNFGLAEPNNSDIKYDFFPEGLEIHDNIFRDNGGRPQEPNPDRGEGSLLPLLVNIKNLGRASHIVWDGAVDAPNGCTAIPEDADGIPLTEPNPNHPHTEQGGRTDERGRPNVIREDTVGDCRWNQWKFDNVASGGLTDAEHNRLCIKNNTFQNTRPQTLLTTSFVNVHITSSDPAQLAQDLLVPASNDLAPHNCDLPDRPVPVEGAGGLDLPFVPNPNSDDARPSPAEVAAACVAPAGNQVNYAALAQYNCPLLSQYGLFSNPQDPRSAANGGGVPFELNSALFSDYAVKYRVLYLPPNTKAVYKDRAGTGSPTATLEFPVGTVIAKTFAFRDDTPSLSENVVETRLLIKRQTSRGFNWIGLPYIWQKNAQSGALESAALRVQGGEFEVSYDYLEPDPAVLGENGQRTRYTGSVERYGVPPALTCISCHGGDDRESGAPPIGLKPRLLNRSNTYAGVEKNQLQHLADLGLLQGLPTLNTVEKHPRWNVPGDTGATPDSSEDIHGRVRAYLEVNCMHCHQPNGNASNSGLFLDSFRTVNVQYGICKEPVAAGRGSGDNQYDIVPGVSADSILNFRVNSAEAGIRMPPLARSVVHGEAAELLVRWVDTVLPTPDTEDEEVCTGPLAGLPLPGGGTTIPFIGALPVQQQLDLLAPLFDLLSQLQSADQLRELSLPQP